MAACVPVMARALHPGPPCCVLTMMARALHPGPPHCVLTMMARALHPGPPRCVLTMWPKGLEQMTVLCCAAMCHKQGVGLPKLMESLALASKHIWDQLHRLSFRALCSVCCSGLWRVGMCEGPSTDGVSSNICFALCVLLCCSGLWRDWHARGQQPRGDQLQYLLCPLCAALLLRAMA